MNEVNLIMFISNICVAALMGALMCVYPAITRTSFLFGVRIPASALGDEEVPRLKRLYVKYCLLGCAPMIAAIIAQYIFYPDLSLVLSLYYPLLYAAYHAILYVACWKKAAALKKARGWKEHVRYIDHINSSHTRGAPEDLLGIWYIASLAIIVFSVIAALKAYPGLPDKIPTHFDIYMRPDAWSDKSLFTVLLLPIINIATFATMCLTAYMIVRAKLQVDPDKPSLSFAQHRMYRARMGHSVGFLTLSVSLMMALITFFTIWPDFYVSFWLILALPIVGSAPIVYFSIASGQGGCRIKIDAPAVNPAASPSFNLTGQPPTGQSSARTASPVSWDDDKYWLLGMFYHNPDDPANIVENRFGNKIGFNYSRLSIKILMIIFAIGVVATYAWATNLLIY